MYVSKEADYALRALIALAAAREGLSGHNLSRNYKIPHNFITLSMPKLMRSGLVEIVKNQQKQELYRLCRKPSVVRVLDVVRAVNGDIDFLSLNDTNRDDAAPFGKMMAMWEGLKGRIEDYLGEVTLDSCALPSQTTTNT